MNTDTKQYVKHCIFVNTEAQLIKNKFPLIPFKPMGHKHVENKLPAHWQQGKIA